MSWWNDLSTHRNASSNAVDGAPRQASSFASPRERYPVTSEHRRCVATGSNGSLRLSSGVNSDEAIWGTSTSHSDTPSLWQTSTNGSICDQLVLSGNSSVSGPQQQVQQQQSRHSTASPPPRGADIFGSLASLSGKGVLGEVVRSLSVGGSGGNNSHSAFNDNAAVLSVGVNGASATNLKAAEAPYTNDDGRSGILTTEDRFDNAAAGTGNVAALVSAGEVENGAFGDSDDVLLYDDADLGTISSLIASLQGHSAQPDAEEERVTNTLRSNQSESNQREKPSAPLNIVDSAAAALPYTRTRGLFADPSPNVKESDLNHSGGSGGDRSGNGAPCGSPCAPTATTPTGDTANIAPLHLTPSMLEGLLANFETAVKACAGEAPAAPSPTPRVTDTELPHRDCYGSHDAQDELMTNHVPLTAADATALTSWGSPLMRNHVSSVVAHKLNIDGGARGTPVQDFRRGAGSSSFSSDPSTPIRQRGTSAPARRAPPHHHQQTNSSNERAASPDSSIDQFFSQAAPPVTSFAPVRHFASSSATEENGAQQQQHRQHTRTESEISLPIAASTYTGGGALHHHVDERGCVTVVDPQRRKLHIPFTAIQTTKALSGRLKTPSLCLLFQSGRCRQGDNCYQVHVDPATVDRLRADVESLPCCCLLHGDCNCHLVNPAVYEGRSLCIAGQYNVPLSRVAYTAGLQRVLQEEAMSVMVNASVLCRLHDQPGGCRFGADCKFIHVCCSILKNELAQVMSNATAASASASPTQTQQQPQQQFPLQRLGSSAPGSPSTFAHYHHHPRSTSGVVNPSLSSSSGGMPPSTLVPQQVLPLPPGTIVSAAAELSLSPPQPMQVARPLRSNGSPVLQALRHSNSGQLTGSPGAGAAGGALHGRSFVSTPRQSSNNDISNVNNNNGNSLMSSANFPPAQLSQATPVVSTAYNVSGSGPVLPAVAAAPTAFANGASLQSQLSGPLYAATATEQSNSSPVPPPVGRSGPPPPLVLQPQQRATTSLPGSPQLGFHLRTLSAQVEAGGAHPHHGYSSSALAQTPNRSGAGSPMNLGLPAARSFPNMCGPTGGRSSSFSPVPRQLSQQLYVQQINQDGTVSFVPVSMIPNPGS